MGLVALALARTELFAVVKKRTGKTLCPAGNTVAIAMGDVSARFHQG
jgi:hypothetical protein